MARTPGVSGDVVANNLIVNAQTIGVLSIPVIDSTTSSFTAPVGDIYNGGADVYLILNGVSGAGVAFTLPLAATLIAALPFNSIGPNGSSWYLRIINAATTQTVTVTTNTGWTLNGTMTIANNTTRDFVATVNAAGTAITLQQVGTGTTS
jgi:hypothetical protein